MKLGIILGDGFNFLFSPLPGEMIQFHSYFSNGLKPPTSIDMFGDTFETCRYVGIKSWFLTFKRCWKVELDDGAWRANPTGCVALNEENQGAGESGR